MIKKITTLLFLGLTIFPQSIKAHVGYFAKYHGSIKADSWPIWMPYSQTVKITDLDPAANEYRQEFISRINSFISDRSFQSGKPDLFIDKFGYTDVESTTIFNNCEQKGGTREILKFKHGRYETCKIVVNNKLGSEKIFISPLVPFGVLKVLGVGNGTFYRPDFKYRFTLTKFLKNAPTTCRDKDNAYLLPMGSTIKLARTLSVPSKNDQRKLYLLENGKLGNDLRQVPNSQSVCRIHSEKDLELIPGTVLTLRSVANVLLNDSPLKLYFSTNDGDQVVLNCSRKSYWVWGDLSRQRFGIPSLRMLKSIFRGDVISQKIHSNTI